MNLPKPGRGQPQIRGGNSSNDLGEFRAPRLDPGNYLLFAMPQRNTFMRPSMRDVGPPQAEPIPTYYPGVTSMGQAQPIHIDRASTVSGIDIVLLDGMLAKVSGVLMNSGGEPTAGFINVRTIQKDVQFGGSMSWGAQAMADGSFELSLAPGEYALEGRGSPVPGGRGIQPRRADGNRAPLCCR